MRRLDSAALTCLLLAACASVPARAPLVPQASSEQRDQQKDMASSTPPAIAQPSPRPVAANPWSESARDALLEPCGRCHRGDLPTALPRALAVFDLTQDRWYGELTGEQMDSLLRRVRSSNGMMGAEREAVEKFVRCAREGDCAAAGSGE